MANSRFLNSIKSQTVPVKHDAVNKQEASIQASRMEDDEAQEAAFGFDLVKAVNPREALKMELEEDFPKVRDDDYHEQVTAPSSAVQRVNKISSQVIPQKKVDIEDKNIKTDAAKIGMVNSIQNLPEIPAVEPEKMVKIPDETHADVDPTANTSNKDPQDQVSGLGRNSSINMSSTPQKLEDLEVKNIEKDQQVGSDVVDKTLINHQPEQNVAESSINDGNSQNSDAETEESHEEDEPKKVKRGRGRPRVIIDVTAPKNNVKSNKEPKINPMVANAEPEVKTGTSNPVCMPQQQNVESINKDDEKQVNCNNHTLNLEELQAMIPSLDVLDNSVDIAELVLKYASMQCIKRLKETYESEMYTKKFTQNLMQQYLDGQVNSSNPLFKNLMDEVVAKAPNDPYLQGITKYVLSWIRDGEDDEEGNQ